MEEQRKINIKASDDKLKGRHSNIMQASHSKEEFFLDFLLIHPPTGTGQMVGRMIIGPSHMKRIAAAIEENVKQYEKKFGKIEVAKVAENEIGFKP